MIDKNITREELIKKFGKHSKDVGSCEVQIALLSQRIHQVSDHLKKSSKDYHSQRGLLRMVSKRRTLLSYLKKNDEPSFQNVQKALKEHGYL
jgi:small subunit ribosomal protein S15